MSQTLKTKTYYSITLNPSDKSQFLGNPNRYSKFHTRIYNILIDLKVQYDLNIEISEPSGMKTQGYSGPRLHLHGIIYFKTREQLQNFLLKGYYEITRISSIDIDTIENLQTWSDYCQKQHILPKRS